MRMTTPIPRSMASSRSEEECASHSCRNALKRARSDKFVLTAGLVLSRWGVSKEIELSVVRKQKFRCHKRRKTHFGMNNQDLNTSLYIIDRWCTEPQMFALGNAMV